MFLIVFIQSFLLLPGQVPKGKIIVAKINSPSLQNTGGENPIRSVTIYLPPGYDESTNRYPVIYYLPGFTLTDSSEMAELEPLINTAINSGKIRPVIVVVPNEYTLYRGSLYTNSTLTGNWVDFTGKDLVQFVDKNYRTISNKSSRGITGYSMGGGGAIKLGMYFPDTFSVVYGISPGPLLLIDEIGSNGEAFRRLQKIKSREELLNDFFATFIIACGRAYSPNPANPPFYCDLPFTYEGDSLIINYKVLELWNKNMPFEMFYNYIGSLKKLRALKFDWGRNDEMVFVRVGCQMFSKLLENGGINHYAEEYIGTHGNKIYSEDGRVLNDMLPFFNNHLQFEDFTFKTPQRAKKEKSQ